MTPCMACSCSSCSHRPRGPCSQIRQGWHRHRHDLSRRALLAAWLLGLGRVSTDYNLFRDAASSVSRERVSCDRPPQPHVSRVADEVDVCVSLKPDRRGLGSPRRRQRSGRSLELVRWRGGRHGRDLGVIWARTRIFRFLGYSCICRDANAVGRRTSCDTDAVQ